MHIETIADILAGAAYDFALDYEFDAGDGIHVVGAWDVDGDLRHVSYSIADLYRDAGGEYPTAPCDGGLMVFESEAEREAWLAQD